MHIVKVPLFNTKVQSGLSAILGPQNSSSSSPSSSSSAKGSPADMAIHARIFYYAQRIGVQIDFARYTAWLARNSDHIPPQVLPDEYLASPPPSSSSSSSPSSKVTGAATTATESLLPWQEAAPKADLYVDRRAVAEAAAGEPSYPVGFAEMLQLLSEGKEIPGIRQIPNTVARDAVSTCTNAHLVFCSNEDRRPAQSVHPAYSPFSPSSP